MINYIRNEIGKLKKSEFTRNIITLFTGTSVSQIIPFIVAPILTRIYDPSDFALLGLFTSTALLGGNIATLQYHKAIMLPEKDEEAINVLAVSFLSVVSITVLSILLVIVLNDWLINLMNNKNMSFWLYLVPVVIFFKGTTNTLSLWSARQKKFNRVSVQKISRTSSTSVIKLLFGFAKYTSGGLIIGAIGGHTISATLLGIQTLRDKLNFENISIAKVKHGIIKYRNFPLFSNWQKLSASAQMAGRNYIISNIFGATVLGYFNFTFGILLKPLQIIGQSVSQVLYQKIAEMRNKNIDIIPIIHKITLRLILIGLVIFIPIVIFGPQIFNFVFGSKWLEAGVYAQLMTPWVFGIFVFSPVFQVNLVLNKQKEYLVISVILNLGVLGILLLTGMLISNIKIVLLVASAFVFLYHLAMYLWIIDIIKKYNINKSYY